MNVNLELVFIEIKKNMWEKRKIKLEMDMEYMIL